MTTTAQLDALINTAIRNGDETAHRYLQQLRDPIAALEDDKARLDWLEQRGLSLVAYSRGEDSWWNLKFKGFDQLNGDTIRAAIDAAMNKPNE